MSCLPPGVSFEMTPLNFAGNALEMALREDEAPDPRKNSQRYSGLGTARNSSAYETHCH